MNKKIYMELFAFTVSLFAIMAARAEVKSACPFASRTVLQCETKVPVWGTAEPGESWQWNAE